MTDAECFLQYFIGVPFVSGNHIQALRNGDEIFPAMLESIAAATTSINFLTYIYWHGTIAETFAKVLAAKAREGVQVRVVLDSFGAKPMPKHLVRTMCDGGVRLSWFRPLKTTAFWRLNNRTHRKILICDHTVAFTGGVGIASEWEGDAGNPGEWRDTHFKIIGPAVAGISAAFWDNWFEMNPHDMPRCSFNPLPYDPDITGTIQVVRSAASRHSSDAANALRALIHAAKHSLTIVTPYFVLDDVFLPLLSAKARQGIVITLLIPGRYIDKRFERWAAKNEFEQLIRTGVNIFRYQQTMLHCKIILVDNEFCAIGTVNFNQRSLRKDDELMLIVHDPALYATLRRHLEDDLAASELVTDASWRQRSWRSRLLGTLIKPFKHEL